jgi:hypothetical protein
VAGFHRKRNLAPKPKPLSFGEPLSLPDPNRPDTPDYAIRTRLYTTERAGFLVETLGAPLPSAD